MAGTESTEDIMGVHLPTSETLSSIDSGLCTPVREDTPLPSRKMLRPNVSNHSLPLLLNSSVGLPFPCSHCDGHLLQQHSHTGTCTPVNSMSPVKTPMHGRCNGTPVSMMGSCTVLPMDTKSNLSETNSAIFPICRICHMPEDGSDSMLISPCRCAGTMQFIHSSCLKRWLAIKTKKSKRPPKCELCRYQYHRHKKFRFQHWMFPRISRSDKILHIIFLVNLVIMIACAIATVLCFLSDKGKIEKFPRNKVDLTTEEIITLSCGVLFFVSFFIAMSVQIKAKHTIYQLFVKFIMQNMEWEIDEYDKSKDSLFKAPDQAFV